MEQTTGFSRRSFLKGVGAAGLSAAALGALAGYAPAFADEAAIYVPGTYTGTGTGISSTVTVTITVDETSITAVEVDASGETATIGAAAADTLAQQVLEAQSADIDGVSGATITSNAVRTGAAAALEAAAATSASDEDEEEEEAAADDAEAGAEETVTDWGVFDENGIFTPSFLIAPDPISDDQIVEEYDVDVAVIGMGLSGMCAARAAIEEGASVMVVDKQNSWSVHSHQICAVNSQVAKDAGCDIDDEMIDFMVETELLAFRDRTSADIWKYMMYHSGEDFDWYLSLCPSYTVLNPFETVGETDLDYEAITTICTSGLAADAGRVFDVSDERIEAAEAAAPYINLFNFPTNPNWDPYTERYPMFPVTIAIEPDQTEVGRYTAEFVEANATVKYACWAKQLTKNDEGRVTGFIFADIDGNYYKVNAAKGVVIATGSYGGNKRMIDYYCRTGNVFPDPGWVDVDANGDFTDMGEGLCMASWAGAAIDPQDTHTFVNDSSGGALGCDAFLLVDGNGNRFMNEDVTGEVLGHKSIRVAGQTMWQIFDDDFPNQVGNMPIGHRCFWKVVDSYDEIPVGLFFDPIGVITRDEVERSATYICDTIDELAESMGVPVENLQATIERYNELAEAGVDEDYGKRADRLYPIVTPPFYASQVTPPIVRLFYGGIMVDANMHALSADDLMPMDGLYVAGASVGNRFHGSYPNVAMGQNHSGCLVFGRLAGTNAAQGI